MSKGGAIQQAFEEVEVCTCSPIHVVSRENAFEEPISAGFVGCEMQLAGRCWDERASGSGCENASFLDGIGNTELPLDAYSEPTCRVQISYKLSGKNHYPPEERIWMRSLTLEASNNRPQSMRGG